VLKILAKVQFLFEIEKYLSLVLLQIEQFAFEPDLHTNVIFHTPKKMGNLFADCPKSCNFGL
jgi:hypothetical protein